ncbi:hybrid sensor histidine kinase/response regulator transcription factor [uncultured Bacteroides sp.]|uniref:hybrid sensor histidine kinase/response regulator transcription factor n=1 Tax=uncultured Bacteroides sp. TaxID=162156 RepID=UPI002626D2EA|nr:hybrid sensor histidine kinase/response regulator transcription factor [uncultured Bacteroides sp.]
MKNIKRHLGLLVMGILCFFSHAQSQVNNSILNRYSLTELTVNNGLPHNFVDDIIKDSKGYLWVSTQGGGVSRYDGNEFLVLNSTSQQYALRSNFITRLCEDPFHRIWMASEQGVDILSSNDMRLLDKKELLERPDLDSTLFNRPVSNLMMSKEGNLWICSENRLYKVVFNKEGLVSHIYDVAPIQSNERGAAVCEIDGYLWFQYKGQIYRINEKETSKQEPVLVSSALQLPPYMSVFCLYELQNDVWIGTSIGLFRYNKLSDTMKSYFNVPDDPSSLSQNYVTALSVIHNNVLLVGTLLGLNLYNSETDGFSRIQHDDNYVGAFNLNSNFVNTLYNDSDNGIVWVGTETGGLTKIHTSFLSISNYTHSPYQSGSLSKNIVNAILEDEQGKLWVGVVEGGLNCKLPGSEDFIHYTTDAPSRLSHNSVSALASGDNNRLYIGSWGGGLGWINRNNLSDRRFHPIPISNLFVANLAYDRLNQLLWITTTSSLLVYDPRTEEIKEPFDNLPKTIINWNALGCCITADNELWIAAPFGLCEIDLKAYQKGDRTYKLYKSFPPEKTGKTVRVTSVFESKDHILWIGTNGDGCFKGTKTGSGYQWESYTAQDGLVSNNVCGIVEDWYGNLWISTLNGLSRFSVEEETFRNFFNNDGLISSQFYWNAIAVSKDKQKLYLGSVSGLTEIRPFMESGNAVEYPIDFTHIRVFGQEVYRNKDGISMHERDKILYIEFAALDYLASSQALYSYRLKGFDDKWITVQGNKRWASYTNLRPGRYKLEVRYAPDGKHWQSKTETLEIEVVPYFYRTPWFVLLVVVIVVFILYRILMWRYKAMKQQQELLHSMVEERTHELEEQKKLLSTQKEELAKQNSLLIEQNEKITDQKNKILEMSNRVEELTVDKLAFFTNITHEFRTPLTLIVGPIERALKLSYNPQVIEQLHLVERNSKYLLSLVNQLLDFRKVEDGHMKIICHHGNLQRFLDDLLPAFGAFANDRNIRFETLIRLKDPYMMFDEDIMRKILTNLISNALKFTPKGGVVSVYVSVLNTVDGEMLFIGVKDTGKGIPETDLESIFNRFYQSDNHGYESVSGQSGTGIGLYLCKKLIGLLGGTIKAKNNRKKGASFQIVLPVERGSSSDSLPVQEQEKEEKADKIKTGKMCILVVEDNKDMRDYIRSILSEYYVVLEASQGEEGLQVLKTNNVDFIISDLMMPVMDGMEFSRRVKSDFSISHIPFLMLTAKSSEEARLESYRMGADAFLLKPFDENLLLIRISNILESRKRLQQKFAMSMDVQTLEVEEGSSDKKFLDRAINVVKTNYKNPDFDVSDFIDAMGVSKSLLNKKMQSLIGQSAGQFIRNYRLNLARELLLRNRETHSMNVSEIAYEVGFNDPKYFTRCFTKYFNVTPSSILDTRDLS